MIHQKHVLQRWLYSCKKYTPSVTPEAWKSKKFKCKGPQRHFRGDFHRMKLLKKGFVLWLSTLCVGGEVQRISTLQLLEQKQPAAKQSPPCQSLIGLSMQKKKNIPPPRKKKKRRKERGSRILRNKQPSTAKMMWKKKERRAINTSHVPCNMEHAWPSMCCQQKIQPLIMSLYVKALPLHAEGQPLGSWIQRTVVLLTVITHELASSADF